MRVLVTGASGLVGSNVVGAAAQQNWEVLGCYRERAVGIAGARSVALDMADRKMCVGVALEFEPDVIVHAAGESAPGRFEREPYVAWLELAGAEHTLAAARAVRACHVLVSCDQVYGGRLPAGLRYEEGDAPHPVSAYGRSKLACEQAGLRWNVSRLTVRAGEVYGVNTSRPLEGDRACHVWERSGTALRLVRRLREHVPVAAPAGLWRSPTYAWDFAQRLCELVAQGCEGVYNMAGPAALGRRAWVELLADAFGCPSELVREGTEAAYLDACGEGAHSRPPSNTALCDGKASAAIGAPAVDPRRGVRLMREQLHHVLVPAEFNAR